MPGNPNHMHSRDGLLVYDKDAYGQMCAQFFDLESNQELMRLVSARDIKVRDGGVLITGDELHYRASKDKGRAYRQAWWCVPLTKVTVNAAEPAEAAKEHVASTWIGITSERLRGHFGKNPRHQVAPTIS
jgi:hypothetical protein